MCHLFLLVPFGGGHKWGVAYLVWEDYLVKFLRQVHLMLCRIRRKVKHSLGAGEIVGL